MRPVLLMLTLAACAGSDPEAPPAEDGAPLDPSSPWPKLRQGLLQHGRGATRADDGAGEPWSFATAKGIFSSPVVDGEGNVYIGSADRFFYALDEQGGMRWSFETGEIIDSSALLDDSGGVFFGSGDGHVYALDREDGALRWSFEADAPEVTGAYIHWFEGNIAMLPSGDLLAPNDNFRLYGIDRVTGERRFAVELPDQTWSSPAVDPETGDMVLGNLNLLPGRGGNVFGLDAAGGERWSEMVGAGTLAASPAWTEEGVFLGSFDGYLRALAPESGDELWSFGARDHLYASPGVLSDGTLIQPAADGTIYAVDPTDGALVWAFDAVEPFRSSPAIGADDVIYVGGGDGALYALNPDGSLRWAMQLVEGARNDLNSSPALGPHMIVVAGEDGHIHGVPYDWCLRATDARCRTGGEVAPDDLVALWWTNPFGGVSAEAPAALRPFDPVTLSLVAREGGDTALMFLDADAVVVEVSPATEVEVVVSGDRRFLTILPPETGWTGDTIEVTVDAGTLVDASRQGLAFSGGSPSTPIHAVYTLDVVREGGLPTVPPGLHLEVARLAAPLPTLMPSYNQIGFDSLHWEIGVVETDGDHGVAWMTGALPDGPDPATRAMIPLVFDRVDGSLRFASDGGMTLEAMGITLSFEDFRISSRLEGDVDPGAAVHVATACGDIPLYGPFVRVLGLCNPQTDILAVVGAAELHRLPDAVGAEVGPVVWAYEDGAVVATLTAPPFQASAHALGVLAVDAATGAPLKADYGTRREVLSEGAAIVVRVPVELTGEARLFLLVDSAVGAVGQWVPGG